MFRQLKIAINAEKMMKVGEKSEEETFIHFLLYLYIYIE